MPPTTRCRRGHSPPEPRRTVVDQFDHRLNASAARNALLHLKIFLQKRLTQKGYPLPRPETVFGHVFGEGGMSNSQNPKVPPTGGRVWRAHIQSRLRCAEACQFRPAVPTTGASPR